MLYDSLVLEGASATCDQLFICHVASLLFHCALISNLQTLLASIGDGRTIVLRKIQDHLFHTNLILIFTLLFWFSHLQLQSLRKIYLSISISIFFQPFGSPQSGDALGDPPAPPKGGQGGVITDSVLRSV